MNYSERDVLLIIDIQKRYRKNYNIDYVHRVSNFLKENKFQEVRCMLDIFCDNMEGEYVPVSIKDAITHPTIFKEYSDDWPYYQIEEYDVDTDYNGFEKSSSRGKSINVNRGILFMLKSSKLNPYYEYASGDFADILREWKRQNKCIHIIGGGLTKCVRVTCKILNVLGIEYKVHTDYCYNISHGTDSWKYKYESIFDGSELGSTDNPNYPKELYTCKKGKYDFAWGYIKNTDQEIIDFLNS